MDPKAARQSTEVQTLIFDKDKFDRDEAVAWATDHDFKSGGVDETDDSYRIRQKDPGEFKEGSFRTIELEDGVEAVIGKPKGQVATSAAFTKAGALALRPEAWGHEFEIIFGIETPNPEPFRREGGCAVVDVRGPLVQHVHMAWDSYDAIRERAAAAFADAQTEAVVLCLDSPGGDVAGCFEFARELRAMREASGKPLLAWVDSLAASAAYAIACAAEWIAVSSTGFVGSIGVIEALCDQTAADAARGLHFAVVTSGARKADGNPHVPITKDAVANLQTQVDGLAELFFALVDELRGIPVATSRAMQARMAFGDKAVGMKLADEVSTWSGLLARAGETKEGTPMPKYLDDKMLAQLRKAMSDGDDDEKMRAKKMLATMIGVDEEQPEKKDEEKKTEGKAEGDEKKPDAKAEDPKPGEEKKPDAKSAKADTDEKPEDKKAAAEVYALTARVHAIEAERAAELRAKALDELLAKRPDFSPETVSTLRSLPVDKVKEAVETWPRIAGAFKPAAAASTTGTRGTTQVDEGTSGATAEEIAHIRGAMGRGSMAGAITRHRNTLELGALSPEEVQKRLAELNAPADKKGAA